MIPRSLLSAAVLNLVLVACALAENPFLSAKSDEPVLAKFQGVEWNDEFEKDELSWTARVTTQRVATAPWGAFFKITFDQIATKAPRPREMRPLYFFTTDQEIVLLNEEHPEAAIRKLAVQAKPPKFASSVIYGLSIGARKVSDGDVASAKLAVKGDQSTYSWTHHSGHFTTVVWQRGVGLIEYAQGYGAHSDGFRLKRESGAKR